MSRLQAFAFLVASATACEPDYNLTDDTLPPSYRGLLTADMIDRALAPLKTHGSALRRKLAHRSAFNLTIAVLGNSVPAGHGCTDPSGRHLFECAYPSRLARMLRTAFPGSNVNVLNFTEGGTSSTRFVLSKSPAGRCTGSRPIAKAHCERTLLVSQLPRQIRVLTYSYAISRSRMARRCLSSRRRTVAQSRIRTRGAMRE
jgi:hypothetical protein